MNVKIKYSVLHSMLSYARAAEKLHGSEIAGWAHYNSESGIYKIAPLQAQIVSSAEVNAHPITDPDYDQSDCVVQWHSHVNMGCFFSGGDLANIQDLMKLYPFLISIVVNCKGEYKARIDSQSRFGLLTIEDVKLEMVVDDYFMNQVRSQCTKAVTPVYTPVKYSASDYYWGEDEVFKHKPSQILLPIADYTSNLLDVCKKMGHKYIDKEYSLDMFPKWSYWESLKINMTYWKKSNAIYLGREKITLDEALEVLLKDRFITDDTVPPEPEPEKKNDKPLHRMTKQEFAEYFEFELVGEKETLDLEYRNMLKHSALNVIQDNKGCYWRNEYTSDVWVLLDKDGNDTMIISHEEPKGNKMSSYACDKILRERSKKPALA